MNLVRADMSADVANSMLAHYDKSVERMLPVWSFYGNETWCMIGYHAVSVLADMIVKQVPGFDYERAFEAMKRTATNPNYDCLPEYTKLGWVPFDKERESVSKTLEYAYDDYCIAQAARALGKEEDYDYFLRRSLSYRNLIDPETKFMRGRDSQALAHALYARRLSGAGLGARLGRYYGRIHAAIYVVRAARRRGTYRPRGPQAVRNAPRLALRDRTARRYSGCA